MNLYLGVDVGSVSTKFALLDERDTLLTKLYLPTQGRPIDTVTQGLRLIQKQLNHNFDIL